MNETKIVKFLAEQMGWWEADPEKPSERSYVGFWLKKTKIGTFPPISTKFNPVHKIEHAFMVEDAIAKMDIDIIKRYAYRLSLELGVPKGRFSADFLLAHAPPKQRSIAATRTLATDAQIQEFGL